MTWRRQRSHTGGAVVAHPRHNVVMVLRTGDFAQNGRSLLIGGRGSAGDVQIPSFLVRPGNWGTMIMTGLFIEGLNIERAINQAQAARLMRIDGEKNLRRSPAQNGDVRMQNNGENNAPNGAVFSVTPFAKPARLNSSLSPANGVVAARGPESNPESPGASPAGAEPPRAVEPLSVDVSGQIEAFAAVLGSPLDPWQRYIIRMIMEDRARQRDAQRDLSAFIKVTGV